MNDNGRYYGYGGRSSPGREQPGMPVPGQYPEPGQDPYGSIKEYSYSPKRKRSSAGRRVLTCIAVVLGAAAVSTTSILAYRLVTGEHLGEDKPAADTKTVVTIPDEDSKPERSGELPTLEQLAAPEDAMPIPDIVEKVSPSVVGISCITGDGYMVTGTGIILSEDGYIITNAHVISGAQTISVVLPSYYDDGSGDESALTFDAEKIGSDSQTDIAVLKINKTGLVNCEIGRSGDVRVGELSIVIGNPLGLDLANSTTAGIISAKDRTITVEDRTMTVIQTDASINNGNSGGPLINAYGQVIGITSAKVSSSAVEGLGFAIPIDDAIPIIEDLMLNGYVTGRPSLGVTGGTITSTYSKYYHVPRGFMVQTVNADSGAAAAGIRKGDIIIAINDTIITSITELNEIKNQFSPGDTVSLTIYRGNQKIDVAVVLDESKGDDSESTDQNNGDYYYDPYDFYYDYFNGF